jgi:hypothetical protein
MATLPEVTVAATPSASSRSASACVTLFHIPSFR